MMRIRKLIQAMGKAAECFICGYSDSNY
jgi:hypothetical protein